jgi:hypothetical protein
LGNCCLMRVPKPPARMTAVTEAWETVMDNKC